MIVVPRELVFLQDLAEVGRIEREGSERMRRYRHAPEHRPRSGARGA